MNHIFSKQLFTSLVVSLLLFLVFGSPTLAMTDSPSVYTFSDFDAKSVTSPSEAIKSMQLSSEYIDVTTKDLVKTVSRYPYLVNIFAFNSYEEGFQDLCERFNGMKELAQRPDAQQEILEYLESQKEKSTRTLQDDLAISVFQIILAQEDIMPTLNQATNSSIIQAVEEISTPAEWTFFEFALDERQKAIESVRLDIGLLSNGTVWTPNGTAVSVVF